MTSSHQSVLQRIQSDKASQLIVVISLLILLGSYLPLHNFLKAQPAEVRVEEAVQESLASAREQVRAYLSNYKNKISSAVTRTDVLALLDQGDEESLKSAEQLIKERLGDPEAIFIFDSKLKRHGDSLGFAPLQLARELQKKEGGDARAVKVSDQWHVLVGHALDKESADSDPRVLIARLPVVGLRYALNVVDGESGLLQLEQKAGRFPAVKIVSIGSGGEVEKQKSTSAGSRYWTVSFAPAPTLAQQLDRGLLSFNLVYSLLVAAVLIGAYLMLRARLSGQALVKKTADLDQQPGATLAQYGKKRRARIITPEPMQTTELVDNEPPEPEPSADTATEETLLEAVSPEPESTEALLAEDPDAELPEEVFELFEETVASTAETPDLVFRDYDIRGLAGAELTPAFAKQLGKALGTLLLDRGHNATYVGHDARESSEELSQALQKGLLSTGCNVVDLDLITTPMCNFAAHKGDHSSCAIMVTASHNPASYNGFKIIIDRQVIAGEVLQGIKPMLKRSEFSKGEGQLLGHDIEPQYLQALLEDCTLNPGFSIVFDTGNAVAGPIVRRLFEQIDCQFQILNEEVDGSFPNHDPNPAEEKNLVQLQQAVTSQNADLGIALDGDADRLVAITGEGRIVWPDELMMVFARDILTRNPGADIVFDVKSTKRLPELIANYSGLPVMCKTGHSHVRQTVRDKQAPLGGEFSGHIFFNDRWDGFDDGLYATLRLLEILGAREQTLTELTSSFDETVFTPEILVPVAETEKFALQQRIASECNFPGAQVNNIDGVRAEYPEGWALVRASNTSPYLTLRFEAEHEMALIEIKSHFAEAVRSQIPQIDDYL